MIGTLAIRLVTTTIAIPMAVSAILQCSSRQAFGQQRITVAATAAKVEVQLRSVSRNDTTARVEEATLPIYA